MQVGQKVKHLRSNKTGYVYAVNTESKKAKIKFEDGTYCNMQSFDNFLTCKSDLAVPPVPPKKRIVNFASEVTTIQPELINEPSKGGCILDGPRA